MRMRRGYAVLLTVAGMLAAPAVVAQNYPTKPIRVMVQFAPGGQGDVIARALATKATEIFRQTVLVDNRPGAAGTIATEAALKANPDGYTFILASASYATNAVLYKLAFNPLADITPVILVGDTGLIVTVNLAMPVSTINDLIAHGKSNPGKLNYGSSGIGGTPHLATELFNQMTGISMSHVPYKGNVLALTDLMSGQLQVLFGSASNTLPQIRAGRVRGIAVTSAKRMAAAPEFPTVADSVPGYEAVVWYALLGPRGLPAAIVTRWNTEINRILAMPDIKERMLADGMDLAGGSPQRFGEVLKRDIVKWQQVVKMANIKVSG